MPRRRQNEPTEKRGRNACWKCKERRIKCTLERPVCSNCARWKHACQYGVKLLWREEALARGICFGRQGTSLSLPQTWNPPGAHCGPAGVYGQSSKVPLSSQPLVSRSFIGDVYFLHTTTTDFEEPRCRSRASADVGRVEGSQHLDPLSADQAEGEDEVARVREDDVVYAAFNSNHHPGFGSQLSLFPSAETSADLRLFDFFVSYMCPGLSNSTKENPYWEFVVPLSFTSEPLFHALLSWAATEAAFTNPTAKDAYSVASVKNKGRALKGLRMEIEAAQGDWSTASGHSASILTTIIILSCNDIAILCSTVWMTHLRAARVLCSMVWPRYPSVCEPDKFRQFCIMWFVSHDIMSRTAWIQETLFDPGEWFASDDEAEIDPMIACSRGLIQQVSAIGTLIMDIRHSGKRKKRPRAADDGQEDVTDLSIKPRRDSIEDSLKDLHQRISTGSDSSESNDVLLQVAEGKRLCSLIYLYACIDNATPTSPAIQALTRRVMDLLADLPPKPSLTFILFVVGTLGVSNEDDRRLVLDKFDSLIKARWLAFVVRARDVVMDVWLDRDLGKAGSWEDLVETKSKLLSLA
ncbi:Zn(2)-C6 fungal-type domain-containing protein [Fusarium keratoplasticum]|uniref:Zn(2)-C6 fungal-type domain-containing protein n=1 Tax=Fusarium keratoplasticum TaxID=1328300 RepID=A0ACC0R7P4_9HYPO|nr:Zn(2)-C6 fungal-type domain-containing protein [Fusarium keratoplasticum]KAI8675757.1 Zn(2)-C6 fungal-type domain-containing protein [Fusarium keratoplasticum]